jgi:hypothetical protein
MDLIPWCTWSIASATRDSICVLTLHALLQEGHGCGSGTEALAELAQYLRGDVEYCQPTPIKVPMWARLKPRSGRLQLNNRTPRLVDRLVGVGVPCCIGIRDGDATTALAADFKGRRSCGLLIEQ